jgi:hypothetical protein
MDYGEAQRIVAEWEASTSHRGFTGNNYAQARGFIEAHEKQQEKVAELEKERDLAREMLITDQTHALCGVFQEKQRKQIERMEKELADYGKRAIENDRVMRKRAYDAEAEITRLREALEKYGRHAEQCRHEFHEDYSCTCGFQEALNGKCDPGLGAKPRIGC